MNNALTRFPPTRMAAIERLHRFVPNAGRDYAARRNYDLGPDGHIGVSALSPYLRARLMTEREVLDTVLNCHSLSGAEKFVQEVFWRTYWKGWLEMRPQVWAQYQSALQRALDDVHMQSGLRDRWAAACRGETGIDCFDYWAQELVGTGYLHNHARMWFASIWIFTLRLPWELGADFFLRHLLDGDPASNTLSWRWVAGIQTPGKTYLARPSNISNYTEGRFSPIGQLAAQAVALDAPPAPQRNDLPAASTPETGLRSGLILHDEDLSPGYLLDAGITPVTTAVIRTRKALSPLDIAPHVDLFAERAAQDTVARFGSRLGTVTWPDPTEAALTQWARDAGLAQIVTSYAPVGPTADLLRRVQTNAAAPRLHMIRRDYDSGAWPHATAGFFRFKDKIPTLLGKMRAVTALD